MIDLTPVEIRKKSDDFDRGFRGFEPGQVEGFLEMVADRLDELQKRNRDLEREVEHLREELEGFEEREEALNEAVLTAQQLREESRAQAEREARLTVREAEAEAEAIRREAERELADARDKLDELRSRRAHFLRSFRALLEGYLAEVEVEQERLRESEALEELATSEEIAGEADAREPAVEPEGEEAAEAAGDDVEAARPPGEEADAAPPEGESGEGEPARDDGGDSR